MLRSPSSPVAIQLVGILVAGALLAVIVSTQPMQLTLGGTLGLVFLMLFLARPAMGLLIVLLARASSDLTFGIPASFASSARAIGSLANVGLIMVLAVAGGMYILARRVPLISLPGGRLLGLLLLTGLLGVVRADNLLLSMNEWIPVLATFVTYALAAHLFPDFSLIQRAADLIAASFILPALLGLGQLITGTGVSRPDFPVPGVTGTFLHPNTFGFFLVIVIALFLGQAIYHPGRRRVVAIGGLGVAFLLLMGTYARVAWAGALIVLLIVGILRLRTILLVLPLAVGVLALVPVIGLRLTGVLAGGGSLGDRLYNLWPGTLQAWLLATSGEGATLVTAVNRLAGLGPGVGPALSRYGLAFIPHNDYLRVLVEYGVFGLVLYFALIGVLAVMAFHTWRRLREAHREGAAVALSFFALTIAFPVMSITDNIFAHTVNQVFFWTLAGLTAALSNWSHAHTNAPLLKQTELGWSVR